MKRLTNRYEEGLTIDDKTKKIMDEVKKEFLIERLRAYEDYHEDLLNRRERIPLAMKELKDLGKEKTYRYRELMGEKLLVENALGTLTRYLKD